MFNAFLEVSLNNSDDYLVHFVVPRIALTFFVVHTSCEQTCPKYHVPLVDNPWSSGLRTHAKYYYFYLHKDPI